MERAAQLKAKGLGFPAIADELGMAHNTVKNYPSKYPPFDALVEWYRDQIWSEEVDELVRKLQPAALGKLLDIIQHDNIGGDDGPTFGHVVQAIRVAVKTTGLEERRKTKEKLETEEEVSGEYGPGQGDVNLEVNIHDEVVEADPDD